MKDIFKVLTRSRKGRRAERIKKPRNYREKAKRCFFRYSGSAIRAQKLVKAATCSQARTEASPGHPNSAPQKTPGDTGSTGN